MSHPVIKWQILAKQPDESEAFYTALFGWRCERDNALGYRELRTGNDGIDGGIWPAPEAEHSFVQLFVQVDDVDRFAAKAEELGGRVLIPKQALPDGDEMAVVLDPQGVSFGLVRPAR